MLWIEKQEWVDIDNNNNNNKSSFDWRSDARIIIFEVTKKQKEIEIIHMKLKIIAYSRARIHYILNECMLESLMKWDEYTT